MRRAIATAVALGLLACRGSTAKSPIPVPPAGAASPPPFTLTLSSGGGFAGLYQGCTLTSQGEVRIWRKRAGAPEAVTSTVAGRADSVLALAKALEAYLGVELKETGNMTAHIRYALPDSVHDWSISGSGASEGAPEPFRTWYARAEAYCRDPVRQP